MANLTSVLKYLEQERNRLGSQLERLNHALSVLIGTSNHRARRTLSAAGRARIAAAQRARWAKSRGKRWFQSLPAKDLVKTNSQADKTIAEILAVTPDLPRGPLDGRCPKLR